jgi:DNA polymerase III subunit gamma/tau
MSYVPLHHKYRPQTFAQLVGQEAIAQTLTNALDQQRIAPAYLFTGARGTGKTSSARIFAKSLNCMAGNRPTAEPCGVCETCKSIAIGNALDVIEIDAASNTGVDNIRELIERAQFAPVQCRFKVYVVDECHMLSNAAFNSLLKTLEEPPDRVVFVLATTDPQRVLPTIISRCQRFDFRRIPLAALTAHLTYIAKTEEIAIAPDAVQLIGQISQGGLRDAESLLDQLSLMAGEVTIDKVWDLVGAVPERDLLALTQAIFGDGAEAAIDCTRRLMDRGREPLIVLQNLASFYRDLLIAKTAPDRSDLVAVTAPTWATMVEFAKTISGRALLVGQQHLRSAEVQLKNSTQPRLWLEITLMGLLPSAMTSGRSETIAPGEPATVVAPIVRPPAIAAPSPVVQPTVQPVVQAPVEPAVQPVVQAPIVEPAVQPPIESVAPPEPATPSLFPDEPAAPPMTSGRSETIVDLDATWQMILNNLGLASTKAIIAPNCFLMDVSGTTVKIGVRGKNVVPLVKVQLEKLSKACAKTLDIKTVKLNLVVTETPSAQPNTVPPNPQARLQQPQNPPPTAISPPPAPRPKPTTPPPPAPPAPSPAPTDAPKPFTREDNAPPTWTPEDPATRAAKSLADAFNGAIVDLGNDIGNDDDDDMPIVNAPF